MLKINLGCGGNILDDWENHDIDVDLTKTLPFGPESAQYVFAEHCIEHITTLEAVNFFFEALRILVPGGILRVAFPSITRVFEQYTQEYGNFLQGHGWGDGTLGSSVLSLIRYHEHKSPWNADIARALLLSCGFSTVHELSPGVSTNSELSNLEGHGKVIGDAFNRIETEVVEAIK